MTYISADDTADAMAAGLNLVLPSGLTAMADFPASPLQFAVGIVVVTPRRHTYAESFAGVMGSQDANGAIAPSLYTIDLVLAALPPNANQAALNAARQVRAQAVAAIEQYFLSEVGQFNCASPGDLSTQTTNGIVSVTTEYDHQGTSREYRGQQVWGAITQVSVLSPEVTIS